VVSFHKTQHKPQWKDNDPSAQVVKHKNEHKKAAGRIKQKQ